MSLQIKFSEESPKLSSRSQGQGLQSALIAEAQDWRNQWKEERKKFSKLQGNAFALQSEFKWQHFGAKKAEMCIHSLTAAGELANQEREYHEKIEALRVQHEEEMFNVKQENYIFSAKVSTSDWIWTDVSF